MSERMFEAVFAILQDKAHEIVREREAAQMTINNLTQALREIAVFDPNSPAKMAVLIAQNALHGIED
jgi:hypothetical protein